MRELTTSIGFSEPERLWALIPVLLFIIAGFLLKWHLSRRFDDFFGEGVCVSNLSFRRAWVQGGLLSCAFGLMVLAFAGPVSRIKVTSYNFMALVDISQSMWCEDYNGGDSRRSRLGMAKENLLSLLDELSDESRFGLGVFAGNTDSTLILVPPQALAKSRDDLKAMVQSIQYHWTWQDGSSVWDVLSQMAKILEAQENAYGTGLTLVLLTDGEETNPSMLRGWDLKAESFRGVRLYFAGMGTARGTLVPQFEEGWRFKQFKKDYQGSPMVSRLDETHLIELAGKFKGNYLRVESGEDLKALAKKEVLKVGEHEAKSELAWVFWAGSFFFVVLFLIL